MFNEINIEINEKKCKSFLSLNNLILKYENKDLIFKAEKIEIATDYLSTITLYFLDFKSKDFDQYEKIIENDLDINEDSINIDNNLLLTTYNKNINEQINNNTITTNYNLKISDIIKSLQLEINIIALAIKIEENNVCIGIGNIQGNNNIEEPNIINASIDNANLYIEKNNNLQEKFNIININKIILINYYLDTELIKLKIDSPILNIFKNIFNVIFNDILFLLNQVDWDVIICKTQIEILNLSIRFSIFNFIISNIYISNFDGKSTDTFYLKINGFLTKNEKNINIFEGQELAVDYTMKSKKEDYLYFKFNNIKINISQNDISFFISLFDSNDKDEEQNNTIYKVNNMNLISKNSESLVMFENENNNNNYLEIKNNNNYNNYNNNNLDDKEKEKNNKIEKEHTLTVEGDMHNINIGFCLNDYTKKSDLNISNISVNLKNANIKNIENELEKIFEYKIIVDRILLKYFDDYNNEIIILNFNNEQKKGIKINANRDKNNQFEIINEKNLKKININKNQVIIRIDYFLLLYKFFMKFLPKNESYKENNNENIITENNNKDNIENNNINTNIKKENNLNIEINFNKTKFQLQTSFDAKEYITLNINDFIILYNSLEDEKESSNVNIKLGNISASIISEDQSKILFNTKNEFLIIKCGIVGNNTNLDLYLGTLIINLSYQDIICILKAYMLNKILLENVNDLSTSKSMIKTRNSIFKKVGTIVENKKTLDINAKLVFNKLDFTLVDNSYGSYQPFFSGALNKISFSYYKMNIIECNFNILLSTYNYISSIWEPIIENLFIKLNYENKQDENNINIDINEIIINLSDMAISSTLIILQHWLDKFPVDQQKYLRLKTAKNNIIQFNKEVNKEAKITNNTIINYTGMDLNIKYNKSQLKCPKESKIELEYINDISQLGPKTISVSINNKNNQDSHINNEFNIFIEKLGIYEHFFENNNNYLIAENTLSKDRRINTSIYSPIIIKNKTFDSFRVIFKNESEGNYSIILKSNDIIGVPLNYNIEDTSFSLYIIDEKNLDTIDTPNIQNKINFNLKDFIDCVNENESFPVIPFGNKVFHMKLIKKLNNLNEILITFQYCIVNCLPCSIIIENKKENKSIKIKRFTQHFIDFYSDPDTDLIFKIRIKNEYYSSVSTKYFKMTKKNESGNNYFTIFYN